MAQYVLNSPMDLSNSHGSPKSPWSASSPSSDDVLDLDDRFAQLRSDVALRVRQLDALNLCFQHMLELHRLVEVRCQAWNPNETGVKSFRDLLNEVAAWHSVAKQLLRERISLAKPSSSAPSPSTAPFFSRSRPPQADIRSQAIGNDEFNDNDRQCTSEEQAQAHIYPQREWSISRGIAFPRVSLSP